MHVAMFLTTLLDYAVQRGLTFSVIKSASAAIFQAHRLAGFKNDVTAHPFVCAIRDTAKRALGVGARRRKQPLDLNICVQCVTRLLQRNFSAAHLQIAAFIMVCFAGFLRYSDAVEIYADQVRFFPDRMEIFIGKRKNLQFRQGSLLTIARGTSVACPVSLCWELLHGTGSVGRRVPLFRQLTSRQGSYRLAKGHMAWSYNQARRVVLTELAATVGLTFGEFILSFGLHSFRSGGLSEGLRLGVAPHVLQLHGGWLDHRSMTVYYQRTRQACMAATVRMDY
ncbi:hypothetical protein EOM75_15305 [Candidatus Falkowbacteria bacterium]|nr:hypothetical protein [Candidatus Falkowbacteria bacterium]